MALRTVSYTDAEGRRWAAELPDGVPDSDAQVGVPIGPPSLADLGLPLDIEVAIHNQLFDRGILTERDIQRRLNEVPSAIAAALRVDANRIAAIYHGIGAIHVGSAA